MTNKVAHFTENTVGNDYVIGDLHGCFDKLTEALESVGFDEACDRVFSVGDLVDRGTQSEESIDWLAKPWFHSVRGNHEQMAIDYAARYSDDYYAYNGGQWMIDLPKAHQKLFAEVFADLPIAIDIVVGDKLIGIIHAECPTSNWNDLEDALSGENSMGYENVAIWNRDKWNYKDTSVVQGIDTIYVGHTPMSTVSELGNTTYIDTGACFKSGKLTIIKL